MAKLIYSSSIDEGSSSLKSINGDYLSHGDYGIVLSDTQWGVSFYKLIDDNTSIENIPEIVKPTTNPNNKRWVLLNIKKFSDDITIKSTEFLNISKIKFNDEYGIKVYDASESEILSIVNNLFRIDIDLNVDEIYCNHINDYDLDDFILQDSSKPFLNPIIGQNPLIDEHLSTKKYVDDEIKTVSDEIEDQMDYIDNNFAKWTNTEEQTPIFDYNPATKKYVDDLVDDEITTLSNFLENNYLEIDNDEIYNPLGDYNPATKKYVDDTLAQISLIDEITDVSFDNSLSVDQTYSGISSQEYVREDVSKFDLLSYSQELSGYLKSYASKEERMPVDAMALEDATDDSLCSILEWGQIRNDAWSFSLSGDLNLLYVSDSLSGGMHHNPPTDVGTYVQIVGTIRNPRIIKFNPQLKIDKN